MSAIQLTKEDQREILTNAILVRDSRIPAHKGKLKVVLHREQPVLVLANQIYAENQSVGNLKKWSKKLRLILPFAEFMRRADPFWVPSNARTRLVFKNEDKHRRRLSVVPYGWQAVPRPAGFETVELKLPERTQWENAVFMSSWYGSQNCRRLAKANIGWEWEQPARGVEIIDSIAFEQELQKSAVFRRVVIYNSKPDRKKLDAIRMICAGAKIEEAAQWLRKHGVKMGTKALMKWAQRLRRKIEEPRWSARMLTQIAAPEPENTRDFLGRLAKRKPKWAVDGVFNSQVVAAFEYTGKDVHLTRIVLQGDIKNGSSASKQNLDAGELVGAGCG